MAQKHTNRELLSKGIKIMAITLPLLILAPYLITLAFLNKTNFSFYIFITIGGASGIAAMWLFYKGISTIVRALFND
jgi:hypothetical protein